MFGLSVDDYIWGLLIGTPILIYLAAKKDIHR